jgi:electron transfer flavoprotein beta subunit
MGIKKAKTKEVKRIAASELGGSTEKAVSLDKVYLPHKQKQTQMISGSPAEAAKTLVEKLKFEVRVI